MARKLGSQTGLVSISASAALPTSAPRARRKGRRVSPAARQGISPRAAEKNSHSRQKPPIMYEMYQVERKQTVSASVRYPVPRRSIARSSASNMSGSQMRPSSHMMQRE